VILVTGASGTIGSALVDRLVADGRDPRISSRHPSSLAERWPSLDAVQLDVLRPLTLGPALEHVTTAYYLVHSMEPSAEGDFSERDADGARAFGEAALDAGVERVIYLGGLGEEGPELSEHLASRHETGRMLASSGPPVLEFRAAMVIGSESASFRMLDDLVRRLPAMIVPRWVETPTQPIAMDDVVSYLAEGLTTELGDAPHTIVEIGGPQILTYRQMIEVVAERQGRDPVIVGVPFLSTRLSSYWCGLTTSVPSALARPLIQGMSTPMVVDPAEATRRFPDVHPISFREALDRASAATLPSEN
jgi:uncharacterized protein YbjT (DUF2867 family)